MVTGIAGRKAVIAKLGMDAHWRGAMVIARALRDAGMEVVYLGHVTPEELAAVVAQEDPALVGLSSLSGSHMTEIPAVIEALENAGARDVVLVAGGAIPDADAAGLIAGGLAAVFPTGCSISSILERLGELIHDAELKTAAPG